MSDVVNHPPHYTFGRFEVIDVIEDWALGFHLGNAVKYIARNGRKGDPLEDLKKARWYLDREIARLEAQAVPKPVAEPPPKEPACMTCGSVLGKRLWAGVPGHGDICQPCHEAIWKADG